MVTMMQPDAREPKSVLLDGDIDPHEGSWKRLRVMVVVDIPPLEDFPSGWAARYAQVFRALASHVDLHVLVLVRGDNATSRSNIEAAVSSYATVTIHHVSASPMSSSGTIGRLARLRQYVWSGLPAACRLHARPTTELVNAINSVPADVTIICLPWLAHLATLIRSGKVVLFLEERWEEVIFRTTETLPRLRRELVRRGEVRRFARLYREAGGVADLVVTISELERDGFVQFIPAERVHVLPHGIDLRYFDSHGSVGRPEKYDVLVLGFTSLVNDHDLLRELIAEVDRRSGSSAPLRWALAGRAAPPSLTAFENVAALGFVQDIRVAIRSAKVVVAAATCGSGVKTTVLQAWALGRTVIGTPIAFRGLPAEHGVNCLVASETGELADLIVRACDDSGLRAALGRSAQDSISERDMVRIAETFAADVCLRYGGTHPHPAGPREVDGSLDT